MKDQHWATSSNPRRKWDCGQELDETQRPERKAHGPQGQARATGDLTKPGLGYPRGPTRNTVSLGFCSNITLFDEFLWKSENSVNARLAYNLPPNFTH